MSVRRASWSVAVGPLVSLLGFACATAVSAQGVKQGASSPQTSSASRSGVGTNSTSDTMGGAFKGTGTPTYGTSPGMGSRKKVRN